MKKTNILVLGLSSLALIACASTTEAPTAKPTTAAEAPRAEKKVLTRQNDKSELVCKQRNSTGSRIGGGEVCYTKEQWARIAEKAREDMRNTTGNSAASSNE